MVPLGLTSPITPEEIQYLISCYNVFQRKSLLLSKIEGVPGINAQVTTDELLNSLRIFHVYASKSKREFDIRSGVI